MAKTSTKNTEAVEQAAAKEAAKTEKQNFTFDWAPAEMQAGHKTVCTVGRFRKVSYETYAKDMRAYGYNLPEREMRAAYDAIKLPTRATTDSAGYDIFAPIPFNLSNMNACPRGITFPTGLRCEMNSKYFLMVVPKSGLGIKQYSRLGNTLAGVDADYYWAENEGDIIINLRSDIPGNPPLHINVGQAVCQAVFVPFGVADDDKAPEVTRGGGLGSTGR